MLLNDQGRAVSGRAPYISGFYLPGAYREGVARVDGRDGLHQERGQQVGEAEVDQQQVEAGVLHGLVVSDRGHH